MNKKITVFLLVLIMAFPIQSLAAGEFSIIDIYDPQGLITSGPSYDSSKDSIRLGISGQQAVKVTYTSYTDSSLSTVGTSKTLTIADYGWQFFNGMQFNCNVSYVGTLYDAQNNVLVTAKLTITGLVNPICDSTSGGEDTGGGGESGCIGCDLFACPGWETYMSKLDEIKAAIPPAPNWPVVADIFRDSIAPQIKSDMAELIGTSPTPSLPSLPNAPNLPTAPVMLDGLDDRGIKAPTGKEAPGLGDSTFSADDIKQDAPTITERQDPTGGFNIVDPIGSLPTQEDFIKNAPIEGNVPLPGNPMELENASPTPTEQQNAAPTPTDPINTAPTPEDTGGAAPLPGTDTSTAPIPVVGNDTAPIPGGGGNYAAPTP